MVITRNQNDRHFDLYSPKSIAYAAKPRTVLLKNTHRAQCTVPKDEDEENGKRKDDRESKIEVHCQKCQESGGCETTSLARGS